MSDHLNNREFTVRSAALVASATLGIACSGGTLPLYTLGVLVGPLQAAFQASAAAIQTVWFACSMLAAVLAPLVGFAVDRWGARPVAMVGLLGVALGFVSLGLLPQSLTGFYAYAALLTVLASGSSPITWSRGLARNFMRNRGLALGLGLSGSGLAGAFAPVYAAWLVDGYGWRGAYVGLALLPLCIALPWGFLFFRPTGQEQDNREQDDREDKETAQRTALPPPSAAPLIGLIKTRAFAILFFVFLTVSIGVGGLIPNFVPILMERGLDRLEAASIAGLIGLSVIAGRVGTGLLMDRFWAAGVLCTAFMLPATACLLLSQADVSSSIYYIGAICIGLAAGAEFDGAAFLIAKYFPMRNFGRLYGILFAGISATAGSGPALLAWLAERWGGYSPVLLLVAGVFIVGALPLLLLGGQRYAANEFSKK
ncbi:MAG: MFS transporter [Pseudomonadota bacterium]